MNKRFRTAFKWLRRVFGLLCFLFALQVSVLAFPQPFFQHDGQFGICTVYSDGEFDADFAAVMEDLNERLKAVELHDCEKNPRLFLCKSQKLYSLLARLAFVPPRVPGFNLSLLGNSFISETRAIQVRENNCDFFKYCAMAGDLAQLMAHEIIHEYMVDEAGFLENYRLPVWKKEGYAEYGASIAVIREDSNAALTARIKILLDDRAWNINNRHIRDYYQSGLLVEFLSEIQGYLFRDIMHDSVTIGAAKGAMVDWYYEQMKNPER